MKKILSALLSLALVCTLFAGFAPKTVQAATVPGNANLLNTYGSLFGHVGTCVTPYQWNDSNVRNFIKSQYNSITMENEMKPDAVLRNNTISVQQAKNNGYFIPSSYTESTVPTLNFSTIDSMMKNAADNGLQIRYHTLVWHAQTPDWYFRSGYSGNGGYVSKSQMNARLEMYIKSVMYHIFNSKYANTVYCFDVVNEYIHANTSGWQRIYGAVNTNPDFVKSAFQYAHEALVHFNKQNSVSLFYNDYNTYMDADKIITMINNINRNGKICNGVGMQSHLSTSFPSASYYKEAISKFRKQGYEIQITEMDAGAPNDSAQATYYKDIMAGILAEKKAGANITAVIWWGLHDGASWRGSDRPLLFSSLGVKKQSYNAVLQAYVDAGYKVGDVSQPSNPTVSNTPSQAPIVSEKLENGTYYIKNVNAQKYLQVAGNVGGDVKNVEIGTGTGAAGQKWVLANNSDGTVTLTSALGNYSLDIANGVDENGANAQIYSSWGGDAQKFMIQKTATNGVYTIATKASNGTKVIDVYDHGKTDGTNVCQWEYTGNPNQQFVFEKVSSVAPSQAPASQAPASQAPASQAPASQAPSSSDITYDYSVVSDWGNGFQGQIKITNKSSKTFNGWTLTFNYNSKISSLWGADLAGQSGNKVTVKNPSWDANFAPGASITINFVADGTDKNAPTSYTFG